MEMFVDKVRITVVGGRGGDAYGTLMSEAPEKFDIVALCDLKPDRLALFAKRFGVAKENTFTDEKEFFEKRRADVLVIATPDADHIRHATYAFNVGYDVLLEKPISDKKEEKRTAGLDIVMRLEKDEKRTGTLYSHSILREKMCILRFFKLSCR